MIVLAIDPGPERSAWVVFRDGFPTMHAIDGNERLLRWLRVQSTHAVVTVVIEKIEAMGMAVGAEVFETVYWSGRFAEAADPLPVERVTRRAVKLHLCGHMRAQDPNIRQALIDRFGGSTAIGTKKAPGPLHGIHADEWSALAVAVTFVDGAAS